MPAGDALPGLDPERLVGRVGEVVHTSWTAKETRLYALACGYGDDAGDAAVLAFAAVGRDRPAAPTFATILGNRGAGLFAECRLKKPHLALHAEQRLELYKPLPAEGEARLQASIPAIHDRGADKGALIHLVVDGWLGDERDLAFRATYVTLARGDGGFGGAPPPAGTMRARPERAPDRTRRVPTLPTQALWYSLTGDVNPIHLDAAAARRAGLDGVILHGLCTYAMAFRAVSTSVPGGGAVPLRSFDARFSGPVHPGETLIVDIWEDDGELSFEAHAEERGAVVLSGGRADRGGPA